MALPVTSIGEPSSPASTFFQRINPAPSARPPSALLNAIRVAIRGDSVTESSDPQPSSFQYTIYPSAEDPEAEEQLAWNDTTVFVAVGGVYRRKYTFANEDQAVQYACTGALQQPGMVLSNGPSGYAHYTSPIHAGPSQFNVGADSDNGPGRSVFGPWATARAAASRKSEPTHLTRGTFIFLRTIGKVYHHSGVEQTFPLPFAVRAAWPLHPHGILIQRALDIAEVEEAHANNGEYAIPTLFTLTDAIAEVQAVGITEGLFGGFPGMPPSLKDEETNCERPLRAIPADEHVLSVLPANVSGTDTLLLTVDGDRRHFTLWRAAYIKPKDTPVPLRRPKSKPKTRKRKEAGTDNAELRRDPSMEPDPSVEPVALPGTNTGAPHARFHTTAARELADRADRIAPPLSPSINVPIDHLPAVPLPIAQMPNMPPSLSSATTLASLATASSLASMAATTAAGSSQHQSQQPQQSNIPTNELSATMNKMALHARAASLSKPDNLGMIPDATLIPPDHGRMSAAFWAERLHTQEIPEADSPLWHKISISMLDERNSGKNHQSLLAVCLPATNTLLVFSCSREAVVLETRSPATTTTTATPKENAPPSTNKGKEKKSFPTLMTMKVTPHAQLSGTVQIVHLHAALNTVSDALCLKADGSLTILSSELLEIPIRPQRLGDVQPAENPVNLDMDADGGLMSNSSSNKIVALEDPCLSNVTVLYADGTRVRISIKFVHPDSLINICRASLSTILPAEPAKALHVAFLKYWASVGQAQRRYHAWNAFEGAVLEVLDLENAEPVALPSATPWERLSEHSAHRRLVDDIAFRRLEVPPQRPTPPNLRFKGDAPSEYIAPTLSVLHCLAEEVRLDSRNHGMIMPIVTLVCRLAKIVRPEWIDYWKRLFPSVPVEWTLLSHKSKEHSSHFDERLPRLPDDVMASLLRLTLPPPHRSSLEPVPRPNFGVLSVASQFKYVPACLYGMPPSDLAHFTYLARNAMAALSHFQNTAAHKRAESAISGLVRAGHTENHVRALPMSTQAPIAEAIRACQLMPPVKWSVAAYKMVGRNDLAESLAAASGMQELQPEKGYKSMREFMDKPRPRKTIRQILLSTIKLAEKAEEDVTGVEMDLSDFLDIRFNMDRRVDEVVRILCSATIPSVRTFDKHDLNEHELAKEQQNLVAKAAERTAPTPLGRAMFTFGTLTSIAKEAFSIPKMEYNVRLQPQNIVITPENGKIPTETLQWAEFHNGVAAALRISPTSIAVESAWIAFNKPSDLTPQHAGFLYGLGLTGHLREMFTWHTFSYLTPKHDFTSIAVLLGLSAANLGTGNRHVTKLLAVHTPALLPSPTVDLNIPLHTQAAGVTGIGLLYMGTCNRRMAETVLGEISRRDLSRPDLSNEYREAYTVSAGIAFGMVMLGEGCSPSSRTSPADLALTERLRILIHGEPPKAYHDRPQSASFDLNLTSPAATVALGLMYLKSGRRDIADILTFPDTVLALNQTQPNFLILRAMSRGLIMWDDIQPTRDWLVEQIPLEIRKEVTDRSGRPVDDSYELAFYNILAGVAFAMALKYAGTARHEVYIVLIGYYDLFTRLTFANGTQFDHKIKRAALKEALNVVTVSLGMVMAGTGEINCLRRMRYAHGVNVASARYGAHAAIHMATGLLFLGGGKATLGTSDAAVACMVAAFFPRYPSSSTDTRAHLQALRHLWVLAVEPRCLIARDVDTQEIVYIPVKIKPKDESGGKKTTGFTQLIAPTLIPEVDKLASMRVDTPRYWPFFLDLADNLESKNALLRHGTIYVKRRTAFLSYLEDPKGSRSLLVRSGAHTGDAGTLDFPSRAADVTEPGAHPSVELGQFITSFANDPFAMSFADRFCHMDGETRCERTFQGLAHAMLYDGVVHDRPKNTLDQMQLWVTRSITSLSPRHTFWNHLLYDVRGLQAFYQPGGGYDQRYVGHGEKKRAGLIRGGQLEAIMHDLDAQLDGLTATPEFREVLKTYVCGRGTPNLAEMHAADNAARTRRPEGSDADAPDHPGMHRLLSWYLMRYNVPSPTVLHGIRFALIATSHMGVLSKHTEDEAKSPERDGLPFFSVEGLVGGVDAGRAAQEAAKTQMQLTTIHTMAWTTAATMAGLWRAGQWDMRSVRTIVELWREDERERLGA